ncbi:MAG: carboxyl transferase domain-containing protein [Thermodesulfobacteriota bacterium]|nr:carboxyl transferase domain-containing protein [Thermodesulfobacteriota bacterium]
MQDNEQQEIEKIAKRFNVPVEFVEAGLKARYASTMRDKLEAFNKERNLIEQGDLEAVNRQHEKGKLTARERIAKLFDQDSFEELDTCHRPYETGFDIGEDRGRGDGVVIGYGMVNDRPVSIWAQDATVMDGTMGTVHARKVTMIIENALNARTPVVAIFDSEGIRAQDAIQYPDFYSASSIAYFQTLASGVVPKISLVMGPCKGELSIIAGLGDFLFMTKNNSSMHLMSPPPGMTCQKLGDPWVHASVTGCCDVFAENDEDCLLKCRQLLSYLPSHNMENPPLVDTGDDPNRREEKLIEIVPVNSAKAYDMYKLISLIVDNGEFFEIKHYWARNLITGFARLDGYTVGIIANNPQDKGGCMTLDAADKMSRFVRFCNAFNIALIWIADTPAFLPAIEEERRGLIRHGARMIMANSEATVPQITVTIRKHYGGGRLSMPGLSLGGDLAVAWPTQEPGLMGAEGAAAIIYRRELASIPDESLREKQKNTRVMELKWGLDMMVREATQKIIDPRDTRPFLIKALRWLRNRKQDLPSRKHENFRI